MQTCFCEVKITRAVTGRSTNQRRRVNRTERLERLRARMQIYEIIYSFSVVAVAFVTYRCVYKRCRESTRMG